MSDNTSESHTLEQVGEITGKTADPLKQHNSDFKEIENKVGDPFQIFLEEEKAGNIRPSTEAEYERAFRHFREFMSSNDRHPACARTSHVVDFVAHEHEVKGNEKPTIKTKLQKLNSAFDYFQREAPFPQEEEYNPFNNALHKTNWSEQERRELPDVSLEKIRAIFDEITNIRNRIIILLGLKLGMRQGEIRNMQLQDIHINKEELEAHYAAFGSHPQIQDRENVICIPPRMERKGNKSKRGRVLPLDDELRRALLDYLLIRPDCGEPWVFVSLTDHEHITDKDRLNQVWRDEVASRIETTERHRPIRSHFGRHWFTTYWRIEEELDRNHVKYMRGDKPGGSYNNSEAIDEYLHPEFEHIKEEYLNRIFKLNI